MREHGPFSPSNATCTKTLHHCYLRGRATLIAQSCMLSIILMMRRSVISFSCHAHVHLQLWHLGKRTCSVAAPILLQAHSLGRQIWQAASRNASPEPAHKVSQAICPHCLHACSGLRTPRQHRTESGHAFRAGYDTQGKIPQGHYTPPAWPKAAPGRPRQNHTSCSTLGDTPGAGPGKRRPGTGEAPPTFKALSHPASGSTSPAPRTPCHTSGVGVSGMLTVHYFVAGVEVSLVCCHPSWSQPTHPHLAAVRLNYDNPVHCALKQWLPYLMQVCSQKSQLVLQGYNLYFDT